VTPSEIFACGMLAGSAWTITIGAGLLTWWYREPFGPITSRAERRRAWRPSRSQFRR
jgi:hypothetical protein